MPPRHHDTTMGASRDQTSGELWLITAILRQAWVDAPSPAPPIRADAAPTRSIYAVIRSSPLAGLCLAGLCYDTQHVEVMLLPVAMPDKPPWALS